MHANERQFLKELEKSAPKNGSGYSRQLAFIRGSNF